MKKKPRTLTAEQDFNLFHDKRPIALLSQIYGVSPSYISALRHPAPVHELGEFHVDLIKRCTTRTLRSLAVHYDVPLDWIRQIKNPPRHIEGATFRKRQLTDLQRRAIRDDPRPASLVAESFGLTVAQVYRIKAMKLATPGIKPQRAKKLKRLNEAQIAAVMADTRDAHIIADELGVMPSRIHAIRGDELADDDRPLRYEVP